MNALYVRRRATLDDDLPDAERIAGWAPGTSLRVFSSDASLMCFPHRADEVGHLLHPNPPGLFDEVMHHRSQPLFEGRWMHAYLRELHRSVRPGGALVVPFADERQAAAKGYAALADLETALGAPERVDEEELYATFRCEGELPPVDSGLTWYFRSGARLALDNFLVRPTLRGADPADVRRVLGDLPHAEPWPELIFRSTGPADAANAARKHSYWFIQLAVKSAVMRRIIRDRPDLAGGLRHLDHGGAVGLLAAELLLDDLVPVEHAVNCEVDVVNTVLSGHLHRFFHERLGGRLFTHHGAAEDFVYREPYHVVSFIGSLLYVPRDAARVTLERAWEALAPGGVLVVQENIRAERYRGGQDYESMFERAELETLLAPFGPVDHYASTVAARLAPDQVGDKTVFRVVTKP